MTNKQELAERRLALLRLMSSPAQPSLADAWNQLKTQFPCSLGAFAEDWDRRFQWLPTVWRLDDPTIPAQSIETLRDIGKRSYAIYARSEAVGDHLTSLSALRTALLAHSAILRYYSAGRVSFTQTNVTMVCNQKITIQKPKSSIFQEYQELLQKAVLEEKEMSEKTASNLQQNSSHDQRKPDESGVN